MHLESAIASPASHTRSIAPSSDGADRRICGQAQLLWQKRCNGRRFARRDSVALPTLGALADNAFILAMANPSEDSFVVDCGDGVRAALERDPVGQRLIDVIPRRLRGRLAAAVRYSGEMGIAVDDSGSWRHADGPVVLYRATLLPLSDDQDHVDHLLGVLSYRLVHTV
jgi:hypothetical protein